MINIYPHLLIKYIYKYTLHSNRLKFLFFIFYFWIDFHFTLLVRSIIFLCYIIYIMINGNTTLTFIIYKYICLIVKNEGLFICFLHEMNSVIFSILYFFVISELI
jgi:hypothetical protein